MIIYYVFYMLDIDERAILSSCVLYTVIPMKIKIIYLSIYSNVKTNLPTPPSALLSYQSSPKDIRQNDNKNLIVICAIRDNTVRGTDSIWRSLPPELKSLASIDLRGNNNIFLFCIVWMET